MKEKKQRGINKRFMAQLFNRYGFLEFSAKNAAEIWKDGRNNTGYENEDSNRDLSRGLTVNLLIREKRGYYRFDPLSELLPSLMTVKTTRKLRVKKKKLKKF